MVQQVPLSQAADRLYALAAADSDSGFAAVVLDVPRHAIIVHWKGAVPATVAAALDHERAQGVAVTVTPARYSRREISAEMNRLASDLIGTKAPSGDSIVKVGPNADYSGLVVTLAPGAVTDTEKAAVLALGPEALMSRACAGFPALSSSSMPIVVTVGAPADPLIFPMQ